MGTNNEQSMPVILDAKTQVIPQQISRSLASDKLSPSYVVEDFSVIDELISLQNAVGRRNSEIEEDSQLQESFWTNRGVFGSKMSLGDISWA